MCSRHFTDATTVPPEDFPPNGLEVAVNSPAVPIEDLPLNGLEAAVDAQLDVPALLPEDSPLIGQTCQCLWKTPLGSDKLE